MSNANKSYDSGFGGIKLPPVIPFLVLGGVNGSLLYGLQGMSAMSAPSFSFVGLIWNSVAGMLALGGTALVSFIFPSYRKNYLSIVPDTDNADASAAWYKNRMGVFVIGGTLNGLVFWLLSSFDMVRQAHWFGAAIVGMLSLTFYTSLLLPIFSPTVPAAP